ncbi:hypothetical protein F4808DRAFT_128019 [Astrocystis sublimbata]|nr:hypothetical protein F4808DRAFT_128019 [Astrocystis sublimbata]
MSANGALDPAAAAAAAEEAMAAARAFNIQLWTLYGVGVLVTFLRTYARIKAVGIRNLHADDLFAWVAILFYTSQTTLGYHVGAVAHGLANNGLTDAERAALSPNDPEFQARVLGSKIQIGGWSVYSALMCFLKLSILAFYIRLTEGLGRRYRLQIWIGIGLVIGLFIASIGAILLSCLPFQQNWQIFPDPGNRCQPAVSQPIVWTCFTANVITDIYCMLIPLPMLWGTTLRLAKKVASSIVLGAGIFVLVAATLKTVFVTIDPVNGAQLAGEWGTREAFVAVFTTNLPMIFPLIKAWLTPIFGTSLWSTQQKTYTFNGGVHTIGGSNVTGKRNRRSSSGVQMMHSNFSATDSQEHMVQEIPMQSFKVTGGEPSPRPISPDAVYVTNKIEVTHEYAGEHGSDRGRQYSLDDKW